MMGMAQWMNPALIGSRAGMMDTFAKAAPSASQAADSVAAGQAAKQFMAEQFGNMKGQAPRMQTRGSRMSKGADDFGGIYGVPAGIQRPAIDPQMFQMMHPAAGME